MGIRAIESPLGVRWTSLATLGAIVVVVTVARRRPVLAGVTAMAWLVAFEVPYEITDILVHRRIDDHLTAWATWLVTVAGWPFAAHALGVRPHLTWIALSAAVFLVWTATGFQHNDPGQPGPVMWGPEALNVGSKTALGVAYLLGALRPERSRWRQALVVAGSLSRVLKERLHRGRELLG